MSLVHSYAVGNGDMFSIRHGSDSCTLIDCSMSKVNEDWILKAINKQRAGKGVVRFISTHPDQDHLTGLTSLDDHIDILNFYTVKNQATKSDETEDFKLYKKLRDGAKAFYIFKGCSRKWMNQSDNERGVSGINILWPDTSNANFKDALTEAQNEGSPNNISPIITYSVSDGATLAWFGDLESDFMESIQDEVDWPDVDIIFAPHHGRDSGKIPNGILETMNPQIMIIGEAPSANLNYYGAYNTITQNSAGTIYFDCVDGWVDIYVGSDTYSVDFLENRGANVYSGYLGSLAV